MEERFVIKKVSVGSTDIEYCSFGKGAKPFVLLPGISISYMREYAAAVSVAYGKVAESYKVYLFDFPEALSQCESIERIAEAHAEALRRLGIKDAYICGASLGSMTAQYIAAEYPELVKKAALASTLSSPNPGFVEQIGRWHRLAKQGDKAELNREMAKAIYSPEYYEKHRRIFEIMENIGTPEQLERFAMLTNACLNVNTVDRLSKIACPVLVIGSMQDKVVFPQGTLYTAENLGCELYMYDGYSHACYDEAPDFLNRVLDFFAE